MQIYTATSTTHELRKVWRAGDNGPEQDEASEGFRYANKFIYEDHEVHDLQGVCDLLNRLADVPTAAIVLGRPLIDRGGRTGLDFEDEPTNLFLADLDSLDFEGTPEEAVVFAFPFLHGRRFVYAFSPSAGFKPGHRLRVAFEVEPMDLTAMQIHAEHWNTELAMRIGAERKFIDYGIYKPSGFIFTARPTLKGLDDPHPVRAFLVDGKTGPAPIPRLPDMIEVEIAPAVTLGQMPTLRWDDGQRHNSVFDFMRAYRTAFPSSVYTECWGALKDEYARLGVSAANQRAFGLSYIQARFPKVRGARRKRKVFPVTRQEVPFDEATRRLSDEIKTFVESRTPGVKVIEADAGLGKTYWALYWLGVETRYAAHVNDMFLTDLYVPNHNLSAQIESDARAQGMSAYTEYGRAQEVRGIPVCHKHEAISKVQGIIKETRKSFCDDGEARCEHRSGCLWWDQWDKSLTHDLRIRTHAHLPLQIAKEGEQSRVPNFVVIDENFLAALIKRSFVKVKDLCDLTRHDMGEWLLRFAQVHKAGMTLEQLTAAGFTVDVCKELIKAEEALAPQVEITPDMSASEALAKAVDYDAQWHLYASFWRRLRDAIAVGSMNRLRRVKDGVWLNWRQRIAGIPWDAETNRPKVPVLVLSATIKRSMVEAVLPVDEWVTIEVEKHKDAKVTQIVVDASKTALLYGTGDRVEEYAESDKAKAEKARQFREDVTAISQGRHLFSYKALREQDVPLSGWFNAVEGLNDWAGGKIDIVGRPLPAPSDVEDMARAIHQDGLPIVQVGEWYPKRPFALFGGAGMTWAERHVDPRVEDVRWVICEGAMMQAAARARHVRQGCEIRLFSNMPLPVKVDEVDEVESFNDLKPEEQEYLTAPVRVASAGLAQKLFRKFAGMSGQGVKDAVGDLFGWAMVRDAEFIEVRLQGEKQWSRVWIADGGWRWLCDRVPVVAWREPVLRKDDNAERFEAMASQSEHVTEMRALKEAFEREAWFDEDGYVPRGEQRTDAGFWFDWKQIGVRVRAA
ncbi:hypothetical protein E2L08_12490 [Palleronia sediminis]|uniref:Uncharacterized protein n=1 Tax=Palleronia sediminis TaxID=2547833 RepID=A0A4R6A3A4_9RHOB|nr:hypothetical protein [Palleronia sediminis]TDL78111.1 hypothetical protein E2L08_12490 [Palleronia sediminis]